jgi:hypothetical protein
MKVARNQTLLKLKIRIRFMQQMTNACKICFENLKARSHMGEVSVHGKTKLNWVF